MSQSSTTNSRFETKYRMHFFTYLRIKNAVQRYLRKDKYTKAAVGKGYLVRSLYYDTDDYRAYHEKMGGDNERIKFRIRSYQQELCDSTLIRVELKGRKSSLVIKKSCFITPLEYTEFMKNGRWSTTSDPVLDEFRLYMLMKNLKPKIITQYFREGYETKFKNDLRITFDHEVESTHASSLFPNHTFYRKHHCSSVVMEIKFKNEPPKWVFALAHQYGLKPIANSKFTQGIQLSRKDLYHPGGVITIR